MKEVADAIKKFLGESTTILFKGKREKYLEGFQISEDSGDAALIMGEICEDVLKGLKPGGKVLYVVPNRDWYIKNPSGKTWWEENESYTLLEWTFDPVTGTLVRKIIKIGEGEYEERMKVYSPEAVMKEIEDCGLVLKSIFTDVEKETYDPDKPLIYALAVKPEKKEPEKMKEQVEEPAEKHEEKKETREEEEPVEEEIKTPEEKSEEVVEELEEKREIEEAPEGVKEVEAKEKKVEMQPLEAEEYELKISWKDSNNKTHTAEINDVVVIGRGRDGVLVMLIGEEKKHVPMMLFDKQKRVSRKHIEFLEMDGKWYLRDVGSTNGTLLNGEPLPGWKKPSQGKRYPSEYVELHDGDTISLAGAFEIKVHLQPKRAGVAQRQKAKPPAKEKMEEKQSEEKPGEIYEDKEISKSEEEPAVKEKKEEKALVPLKLKWVDGNFNPQEIEIERRVVIGRGDRNVMFIYIGEEKIPMGIVDSEKTVMEKHIEFKPEGYVWFAKDLGSDNGVTINGELLPGWEKGKESEYVELHDGDEILVGKYLISVELK